MPGSHGVAGIGVLVLVLGSACGVTPPAGPVQAAPPAGAAAVDTTLTEVNQLEARVRAAQVRLAEQCMAGRGFTVHPARQPVTPRTDTIASPLLSPGLADARARGYGIGESGGPGEPTATAPESGGLTSAEQARYEQAWSRTEDGAPWRDGPDGRPLPAGCLGEAYAVLYGPGRHGPRNPVPDLTQAVQAAYDDHPLLQPARTAWSTCVQQREHPRFADPGQAYRYAEHFHYPVGETTEEPVPPGGPWPFTQARAKEIALAVADAECADRSGLREVHAKVWREVTEAEFVKLKPQFAAYRDTLAHALDNARTALEKA